MLLAHIHLPAHGPDLMGHDWDSELKLAATGTGENPRRAEVGLLSPRPVTGPGCQWPTCQKAADSESESKSCRLSHSLSEGPEQPFPSAARGAVQPAPEIQQGGSKDAGPAGTSPSSSALAPVTGSLWQEPADATLPFHHKHVSGVTSNVSYASEVTHC